MADWNDMTVEEILNSQGGSPSGGSEPAAAEASSAPEPAAPSSPPAKADTSGMSIADMLAAQSGDAPAAPPAAPAAPADPAKMSIADMLAAQGGGKPAAESAPPAAAPSDPGKMSIADMLAAQAAGGGQAAASKPAASKPAAKAKPKKAAPAPSGPKESTSALAGGRGEKPGPISKAEAAARAKADPTKGKKVITAPPMPEKPAYAQRPAAAAAPATDRRGFVTTVAGAFLGSAMAIGFSSLAVTNILWVLGLARYMFPNILTEPPTQFKVGFPGDYAFGQVETKFKAQFGVWIVRFEYQGGQQIYALKSVCTHLGCTPNWLDGEQKFKCPCHGSGFYKDGINFEGPAPRPLERYAIRIADDGQLEVDKSRKFNEELGQWADSASFVSV